jgi:hypothetical protein
MFLRWRNGILDIGPVLHTFGWGIQLTWNRIEDLGETPAEGDVMFADYVCLDWWPGRWIPRYTRRSMKVGLHA